MAKQPKRIKAWTGDRDAAHSVEAAIALVKANAKAKFDESIEISVNLGVDPRHADQQVRGVVNLPSGTGRDVRVAVFAKDAKAAEATLRAASAVLRLSPQDSSKVRRIPVERAAALRRVGGHAWCAFHGGRCCCCQAGDMETKAGPLRTARPRPRGKLCCLLGLPRRGPEGWAWNRTTRQPA